MNERLRAQRADIIGSMKDPAQTIANAELSGRLRSDAGTRTRRGVLTRLGRSRSGVTFSTDAELPDMSAESAGDLSKMVAAWGDAARRQGLSEEQARRAIAVSLRNLGLEADQVEALLAAWDSSKNDDEDEGGDEDLDDTDSEDLAKVRSLAARIARLSPRGGGPEAA